MNRNPSHKGNHLTKEDRSYIEDALKANYPLRQIAEYLGKDPTTISKEIRRNRVYGTQRGSSRSIVCAKRKECTLKTLCSQTCNQLCKKCSTVNCYRQCSEYIPETCSRLDRFPHVCNGCVRKMGCRLVKQKYCARTAQTKYETTLRTAREGITIAHSSLDKLDALITPLIQKGQSIAHIYAHHRHEIPCSERTLYRYISERLLTVRNIDLPRKVRYKPRRRKSAPLKNATHRIGRTYKDFTDYLLANPDIPVVEMDTVYGGQGGKALLTLFFRSCSFMAVFLLDECTQNCVQNAFDQICTMIGLDDFKCCFPIILTDNGSEFQSPESIEYSDNGTQRTRVFYCDPMASFQKARIEKNHEYIRYILPKGRSFDHLTQEKITLMMNHINSAARASLNDNTPSRLAQLHLKESLLDALLSKLIPPDEVHLKPALLK